MKIQRIDSYTDSRFSERVLQQHGAFLAEGQPFSVEIISDHEAVISGDPAEFYPQVIEEFRFFAEHITCFYNEQKQIVAQFPPVPFFEVELTNIQPSQFYVDEEKVQAVSSFIHSGEDVIIPLMQYGERYLSLDGHTRMFAAQQKGLTRVKGFFSEAGDYIFDFGRLAQERSIFTPMDLQPLSHEDYCIRWHKFCDDFFAERSQ